MVAKAHERVHPTGTIETLVVIAHSEVVSVGWLRAQGIKSAPPCPRIDTSRTIPS
jgi:hypothetical protein